MLGILASIQAGIMVWELRNACGEGGKFRFEKVYAWSVFSLLVWMSLLFFRIYNAILWRGLFISLFECGEL